MSMHIGRSTSTSPVSHGSSHGVNVPVEHPSIDLDNNRQTARRVHFQRHQPTLYGCGEPGHDPNTAPEDQPLPGSNSNLECVQPAVHERRTLEELTRDENGNGGSVEELQERTLEEAASPPDPPTPGSSDGRHDTSQSGTTTSRRLHSASTSFLDDVSSRIQGKRLRVHHQEGVTSSMKRQENLIYLSIEGDAHIIVFTEDGSKYYTIELTKDDGGLACRSKQYTGDILSLESLGKVALTRRELHETGLGITEGFGVFHQLFNNSRDFCNDFLREIGLGYHVTNAPLRQCGRTRLC